MAKSNLQLLQEAIEAGDLDRAKELTAKIVKMNTPAKAPKKPARAKREVSKDNDNNNESSYIYNIQQKNDGYAGRSFVDAQGKHHTYAKTVPIDGMKFVNTFDPTGYEELTEKEKRFEKQIKKIKPTPRPGQSDAARDKAEKVYVQCSICNDRVSVWPWEIQRVPGDDEINFRCSKKRCTTWR